MDKVIPSFDDTLPAVRIFNKDIKKLEVIVEKYPARFESVSHAIRCAVMQFIQKEL